MIESDIIKFGIKRKNEIGRVRQRKLIELNQLGNLFYYGGFQDQ